MKPKLKSRKVLKSMSIIVIQMKNVDREAPLLDESSEIDEFLDDNSVENGD
ncbi:hypothetical protein Tco_0433849, partial [Tanacetum coccineum]